MLGRLLEVAQGKSRERLLVEADLLDLARSCLDDETTVHLVGEFWPPLGTPGKPWRRLRGGEQVANSYGYLALYTHAIAMRVRGGVLLIVDRGPSFARCIWRSMPWVVIPKGELR